MRLVDRLLSRAGAGDDAAELAALWPRDAFFEHAELVASDVVELLADEPRWVHRRTETVTFNDESSLRRQMAVHFELPRLPRPSGVEEPAPVYVPLSLLEKTVLTNFDVRDETGASLPVLTRQQNARIAAYMLIQQAQEALRAAGAPDTLYPENARTLATLAGDDSADWGHEESTPPVELEAQARLIALDPIASGFLTEFTSQFLLLVPLRDGTSLEHRIVKFAYDAPYQPHPHLVYEPGWGRPRRALAWSRVKVRDVLEVLGICSFRTGFTTPAIADAESYHVELVIPEEVFASPATLFGADGEVLSQQRGAARVHLYASRRPAGSWGYVLVDFFLRPGLIAPVFLLSLVTTTTLLGGVLAHSWWHLPKSADAAATLVVALPTFFAPAVAPGGHRLVRRMFKGLRSLVFLSALISFGAAATLALDLPQDATITTTTAWCALLACSAAITLVSAIALYRSRKHTRAPVPGV